MNNRKRPEIFNTAIYIRLSQDDGDKKESDSVTNQRSLLLDYIEEFEDIVLHDVFIDDGFTGSNFNRPNFQRMLKCIDSGEINCIVIKDLSRFGRDHITMGQYLGRDFPTKNVRVLSYLDNWDSLEQPYGLMMEIKNLLNTQYVRDTSAKIRAVISNKQKKGEFIGSSPSYGYKKDPRNKNKLIIDEYPSTIIRRIFNLFVEGYGKQRIAKILDSEGILCPSEYKKSIGSKYQNPKKLNSTTFWTYATIDSILRKEIYIGNMVQGTKETILFSDGKQQVIPRENHTIVCNTHEAIIDPNTWEKVQTLLTKNRRMPDLTKNNHVFKGYLKCADCGRAMAKSSHSTKAEGKKYYFSCGGYKRIGKHICSMHKISYDVLQGIVLSDIKQLVLSMESQLEKLIKQQKPNESALQKVQEQELQKLKAELEKVAKLKKECYEDYKEELISKDEYVSYRRDYITKEEKLLLQINSLEAKLGNAQALDISEQPEVKKFLKNKSIDALSHEVVVEMISDIHIHEDQKVSITYNLSEEVAKLFSPTYTAESI